MMVIYRITNPKILGHLMEYAKQNQIIFRSKSQNRKGVLRSTVHGCKGLEAKIVFILNVDKDLYGFPCELEDPIILDTAKPISEATTNKEEEERRLFYVGITRAKEQAIIFNQKCKESKFINEIKPFIEVVDMPYAPNSG